MKDEGDEGEGMRVRRRKGGMEKKPSQTMMMMWDVTELATF